MDVYYLPGIQYTQYEPLISPAYCLKTCDNKTHVKVKRDNINAVKELVGINKSSGEQDDKGEKTSLQFCFCA